MFVGAGELGSGTRQLDRVHAACGVIRARARSGTGACASEAARRAPRAGVRHSAGRRVSGKGARKSASAPGRRAVQPERSWTGTAAPERRAHGADDHHEALPIRAAAASGRGRAAGDAPPARNACREVKASSWEESRVARTLLRSSGNGLNTSPAARRQGPGLGPTVRPARGRGRAGDGVFEERSPIEIPVPTNRASGSPSSGPNTLRRPHVAEHHTPPRSTHSVSSARSPAVRRRWRLGLAPRRTAGRGSARDRSARVGVEGGGIDRVALVAQGLTVPFSRAGSDSARSRSSTRRAGVGNGEGEQGGHPTSGRQTVSFRRRLRQSLPKRALDLIASNSGARR